MALENEERYQKDDDIQQYQIIERKMWEQRYESSSIKSQRNIVVN